MNKEIQLDDAIELIKEKLNSGGNVTFSPHGTSMLPMLRDGEDVVILSKPKGRLHLFDIPLYKRENGTYVLHRVVGFDEDGSYILRGDNQIYNERGIKDSDIIAVVTGFYRKGKPYTVKSVKYRMYVNFWYYFYYSRRAYHGGRNRLSHILKKLKKAENNEENVKSD